MQPRRERPRANSARRRRRDDLGIGLQHHAKATPRQCDRHVGVGRRIATDRRESAASEIQHVRPPKAGLEHRSLRHFRTGRRTLSRLRLAPPGVGGHVDSPPPDGTPHARRHHMIAVVARHPQRHNSPHIVSLKSFHRPIGPAFRGPPARGEDMHHLAFAGRHAEIHAAHQSRSGGRLHEPHLLADIPRVGVFAAERHHDFAVVGPVFQNADERLLHGRSVGRSGDDDRQPRRSHQIECVRHRQPPGRQATPRAQRWLRLRAHSPPRHRTVKSVRT